MSEITTFEPSTNSGTLEFKVGSLLKNIIGKDLITDDYIAVFELVKNSYDAHAKNVIITFKDNQIIIADDGKGMSLKNLKDKWLFVAYSAKKDGSEDIEFEDKKKESYRDKVQVRKHYAGAKGIGRFSCDRLGEELALTTRKINETKTITLNVNWNDFELNPKAEFQSIKVRYTSTNSITEIFPNNARHGTILKINKSGNWTRKKLIGLKHSLEKLINPFSETNEFNIEIICERESSEDKTGIYTGPKELKGKSYLDRDKVNGRVKNSILEILNLKTTHINVVVRNKEIITELNDRGAAIYKIKEPNAYSLIDNLQMDLYFLNFSAKNNFTRKMGVRVVNFGSVFLFKNGFRVQPYGEAGDDSWGLDYRAQQGFSRYLGTRDLFGRVDIITNSEEFKEVTSRDGGLVETEGYNQLLKTFKENALKRLERYVAGVLWGEGFKRKNYFGQGGEATKKAEFYREKLQEADKHSDNIKVAKANLGSKLDFIQIIKSLANDKNIEILYHNKDLIDLINDNLDDIQTKFIIDIEQIAKKTNDVEIKNQLAQLHRKYEELRKAKEKAEKARQEAEKKAKEEAEKRAEAEKKAKEEAEKRAEAEKKAKEEAEKRKKAEEAKLKAENEKLKAENEKLKAEKARKEEEEKRKKAESEAKKRKQQVSRYKAAESIEYKDLRASNHIIGVYSDDISKKILLFKRKLDKGKIPTKEDVVNFIQGISLVNEKVATLTRFTTKSNYLEASLETNEDIVKYIVDYINNTYRQLYKTPIDIISNDATFITKFQPIELCTALDNIFSNSRKKNASKVIFEFTSLQKNTINLSIKDVGKPLSKEIEDWKLIFEEGITTTRGAGLGLANVKKIIEEDLNGHIIYNPNYTNGFELVITLKK